MDFRLSTAELFVPDGTAMPDALARTTHMAVGAHQDDLEIMAYAGIQACFQKSDAWFAGVVVTNGAGSPRDDLYRDYTDEDMRVVRFQEQRKAACLGEYGAQALLDYPSSAVKDPVNDDVVADLVTLLEAARPGTVYTHNLADKHDTHVGVTLKLIRACRAIAEEARPRLVLGCEVWRDLDWLCDGDKVGLDTSAHENLQAALLGVFDSQICGGKRYDLATMGRRKAHATYFASHGVDESTGLTFAMDLTPLVRDVSLDPAEHVVGYMDRFRSEVTARLEKLS